MSSELLDSTIAMNKATAIDSVIFNIIAKLNIDTELVKACIPVVIENLILMNQKQHDYGSDNLTKFGTLGVVVRASDKLERLVNLTKPGAKSAQVKDETIADTLRDLANYGLIGYVIEKRLWPKAVDAQ